MGAHSTSSSCSNGILSAVGGSLSAIPAFTWLASACFIEYPKSKEYKCTTDAIAVALVNKEVNNKADKMFRYAQWNIFFAILGFFGIAMATTGGLPVCWGNLSARFILSVVGTGIMFFPLISEGKAFWNSSTRLRQKKKTERRTT